MAVASMTALMASIAVMAGTPVWNGKSVHGVAQNQALLTVPWVGC
jgi:hypothetical protein